LASEVAGHEVHAVGQVFPGAGHTAHICLTAELAFGAHFTSYPGHLRGERAQLIDHRVQSVLQFQNLTTHVHRDLARHVAICNRRGYLGDVAHLCGEITGHHVHAIGEVLPSAGHAFDI